MRRNVTNDTGAGPNDDVVSYHDRTEWFSILDNRADSQKYLPSYRDISGDSDSRRHYCFISDADIVRHRGVEIDDHMISNESAIGHYATREHLSGGRYSS